MSLDVRDERHLAIQRGVTYACLPLFVPLFVFLFRVIGGYRCPDLRRVRANVKACLREAGDVPVLICPNHLTLIDSMLLAWLLFDLRWYLRGPRFFPWHTPEVRNFAKNWWLSLMCYFGRCVFVNRGAGRAGNRQMLDKIAWLLRRRSMIFLFPEGTRSRSGRVERDQVTYSVGELLNEVPECAVLCVYFRGRGQLTWGDLPRRGEIFSVDMKLLERPLVSADRRGAREIAYAINAVLRAMEERFFQNDIMKLQSG